MNEPAEVAGAVVAALQSGDVTTLRQLLTDHPRRRLRTARAEAQDPEPAAGRHRLAGALPNGPEVVRLLVEAGADPDTHRPGGETPLHWAASSDDARVAASLIESGAA